MRNKCLNLYRAYINDEQLGEYCRYKTLFKDAFTIKANVYKDKLYNKIKICKNRATEIWSNLKATKGGFSTINKDE